MAEIWDPVVCLRFFFFKRKNLSFLIFCICYKESVGILPHEESLSQIPAITYAHGNY
jgi:hypothetical protein